MLIINGTVPSSGESELTILNRSFFFGDGLFEILRVFRGKILFIDQHLHRLLEGMKVMQFEFDADSFKDILIKNLQDSVRLNQITGHGRLRLQVYRDGLGEFVPVSNQASFLIEGSSFKEDLFRSAITTSLQSYHEIHLSDNPLAPFQHANALPFVLASIHARQQHREEGLLFHKDWVATSTLGNLFYVHQKKLFTSSVNCGIPHGIMRGQILDLADRLKIPVEEKRFKAKSLLQADEIFVSNSIRGIVPVSAFDNLTLDSHQFVITSFLRNCLHQYIEEIYQ